MSDTKRDAQRDAKRQLLRDLLPFMLVAVIIGGVYAASVGPAGIEGMTWINGTSLNIDNLFISGTDYTANVQLGSGTPLPADYDYLIIRSGANYKGYDDTSLLFTTASFSQGANWIMGNLTGTRPEIVKFRGALELDTAPISVPDYAILDGYGAEIDLTGDIAAIFQSENMGAGRSDFVHIRGFRLDGNKAARATGTGIEGTFWNGKIYDNVIIEMSEYGIDLRSYTSTNKAVCNINNNWIGSGTTGQANSAGGIRLGFNGYSTVDCIIEENFLINNGNWQIIIEQGGVHRISNNHFAGYADAGDTKCGGIFIGDYAGSSGNSDVDQVGMYNNHFEQHQRQGLYIYATSADKFSDMFRFTGNDLYDVGMRDANNTYSAIHFEATGTAGVRFSLIADNTGASYKYTDGIGPTPGVPDYPEEFSKALYFIELEGANVDYILTDGNVIQSGQGAPAWTDYVDGGGSSTLGDNININ